MLVCGMLVNWLGDLGTLIDVNQTRKKAVVLCDMLMWFHAECDEIRRNVASRLGIDKTIFW